MGAGVKDDTLMRGFMGDEATLDESIEGLEFSPDELRDFLAGDLVEVQADPQFKERLRAKLWDALKSRRVPPAS
jgi:hypothetical protein